MSEPNTAEAPPATTGDGGGAAAKSQRARLDLSDVPVVDEVRRVPAYDALESLEERERRWGFTLADLRAASAVVRRLFHDPTLFVGDPYLADSRLYTMITRDRQAKREFREAYKAIQNEEKSRKKRYQRMVDARTRDKTAMKRERQAALDALTAPPLMLGGAPGAVLQIADHAAPQGEALEQRQQPQEEDADDASDAEPKSRVPLLEEWTAREVELLRGVGALECVLRLEQAYAGVNPPLRDDVGGAKAAEGGDGGDGEEEDDDGDAVTVGDDAAGEEEDGEDDEEEEDVRIFEVADDAEAGETGAEKDKDARGDGAAPPLTQSEREKRRRQEKLEKAKRFHARRERGGGGQRRTRGGRAAAMAAAVRAEAQRKDPINFRVVTHLNALYYRYRGHNFGSQMPPPLFMGAVPRDAPPETLPYYVHGAKLELARALVAANAQPLPAAPAPASPDASLARALAALAPGQDLVVRSPAPAALRTVDGIRSLVIAGEEPSAAAAVATAAAPAGDVLAAVEAILITGDATASQLELFSPRTGEHQQRHQEEGSDGSDFAVADVAVQTLNLFVARRLYTSERVNGCGPAPCEVVARAPVGTDEEPDTFSPFEEVQLFCSAHGEFYQGRADASGGGSGGAAASLGRKRPRDEDDADAALAQAEAELRLNRWVSCYTCHVRYRQLHPFYYSMCHLCSDYNFNKRLLARDLRGRVVLLTGCRIKIGYAMAVSLLRCGATLLGTTRFAHEAVARFQREPDYSVWRERLHLFSLDLRDMWVVTQFCAFVRQRYPKIFAIINNAAQTIARTAAYTAHLRAIEQAPPPPLARAIQGDAAAAEWHGFFLQHATVTVGESLSIDDRPHRPAFMPSGGGDGQEATATGGEGESEGEGEGEVTAAPESAGATTAAAAATAAVALHHHSGHELVFDRYDTQAEASDTRTHNSWVSHLSQVQGGEAAEVMAINAISPFIINGRLKPCLENREGDADPHEPRFIINVSAMEGQFYRFKQTTHPHTNMAKAALNMMTRTSGEDYARSGIYMNSVDTGWITDEAPRDNKVLCPIDEVDAAARCLDLIYTNRRVYGRFYKDYRRIPW